MGRGYSLLSYRVTGLFCGALKMTNWYVISREYGAASGETRFSTNRSEAYAAEWLAENALEGREELVVSDVAEVLEGLPWPAPMTASTVVDDFIPFIELAKQDPEVGELAMLASRLIAAHGDDFARDFDRFLSLCGSQTWADNVADEIFGDESIDLVGRDEVSP